MMMMMMMMIIIIIVVMVVVIMKCVRVNGIMTYTGCFCVVFFVFWCVRKTAKSDCWLRHVHLSVRIEQPCSNWTGFRESLSTLLQLDGFP